MTVSISLLKERVVQAALALDEVDVALASGKTLALYRAVRALKQESWRTDDATPLVQDLYDLVKEQAAQLPPPPRAVQRTRYDALRKAEAFLGLRKVERDDPTPPAPTRRAKRFKLPI